MNDPQSWDDYFPEKAKDDPFPRTFDPPSRPISRYDNDPGLKSFILPDTAPGAPGQLYNLEADPGETRNLYFEQPQIVKELKGLLDASKVSGHTAPRSKQ